jgi:hypothetical protein
MSLERTPEQPRTLAGIDLLASIYILVSGKPEAQEIRDWSRDRILAIESEAVNLFAQEDRMIRAINQEVTAPALQRGLPIYTGLHKQGEPHRYRIECEVCGERGTVQLAIEPQVADWRFRKP